MVGEAKARRVARVSSISFEASFDRASEGRYEGRFTISQLVRQYNINCVEGDRRSFRCTEFVSQSD